MGPPPHDFRYPIRHVIAVCEYCRETRGDTQSYRNSFHGIYRRGKPDFAPELVNEEVQLLLRLREPHEIFLRVDQRLKLESPRAEGDGRWSTADLTCDPQ